MVRILKFETREYVLYDPYITNPLLQFTISHKLIPVADIVSIFILFILYLSAGK